MAERGERYLHICPECGEPFGGEARHNCTLSEAEMRGWVLRRLASAEIAGAPSLTEAIAAARRIHGDGGHGGTAPHRPHFRCGPDGVTWRRVVWPEESPAYRLTWREVAVALRAGAEQLTLFEAAS